MRHLSSFPDKWILRVLPLLMLTASESHSSSVTLLGRSTTKIFYSTHLRMSWFQAYDYCVGYGFELGSIETQQEQDIIDRIAKNKMLSTERTGFWLGGTGDENNEWTWNATGTQMSFRNWEGGIPSQFTQRNLRTAANPYGNCLSTPFTLYTGVWVPASCATPYFSPLCMIETKDREMAPVVTTTIRPDVDLADIIFVGATSTGTTFYTKNEGLTFAQAQQFCIDRGLSVASVVTIEEGLLIGRWAAAQSAQDFITLINGNILQTTSRPFHSANCENMPLTDQNWNSAPCKYLGRPLCMTTIGGLTTMPTTTTTESFIPEGLTFIGASSSTLFYGDKILSRWSEARDICTSRGLELAEIHSLQDQEAVTNWGLNNVDWTGFWTAGSDQWESRWTWSNTGARVPLRGNLQQFQNWAVSEPSGNTFGQGCIVMYLRSGPNWVATRCNRRFATLCMHRTMA